ncbi:MAG: trigger factor [Patescibacteria group bacterium]|jgi:trigger factor
MIVNIAKQPKSQVEISVELTPAELLPYLAKAAEKISVDKPLEGFRPGKAPYEIVIKKYGEMAVLSEAVDDIISKTYYQAIKDNNLTTIGQPQINLEKLAPENSFSYKATVAILPQVKIGDLTKIKLKKEPITITEEQVRKIIEEIRKLRGREEKTDKAAESGDLVKLDFDVSRDGVPIDQGSAKNYPLLLGEDKFIPGFEDRVIGLKAGEEKEFTLNFPEKYFEKSLAGKPAEFKIKINEIAKIILPAADDELAKMVSGGKFSTLEELKKNIKDNLLLEEQAKQDRRLEIEMLEEAVKLSEFEELPEILIHEEIHRMLHELEDSLSRQGLDLGNYLQSLKKTEEEMEKEMEPQAEIRVKTAILSREIYQQNKFEVTPDEVDKEIEEMLKNYPPNPDVKKQLESETYRDYLKNSLGNRKVMAYLKDICIK